MADHEVKRRANIGISSLILIFIVLCLVTFGLLSLGNARREEVFARKNAEAVQEYYRADGEAVAFLDMVDRAMKEAGKAAPEDRNAAVLASAGDYYQADTDMFLTEVPMANGQALRVQLVPDWEAQECRVGAWKVCDREEYEIDRTVRVWGGGEDENNEEYKQ